LGKIREIPGAGKSNSPKKYSFSDKIFLSNGIYYNRLKQIDNNRLCKYSKEYSLQQNYPNPLNPTRIINYSIAKESHIHITIYNDIGSKVALIVDENKPAGNYSFQFNESTLPSGVYFYRLQAGSFTETRKMILLKKQLIISNNPSNPFTIILVAGFLFSLLK
jgi:hypothetical protein